MTDLVEHCKDQIQRQLSLYAESEKNKKGYIPAKEAIFQSWQLVLNGLNYMPSDPELRTEYMMSQVGVIKEFVDSSVRNRDELGLKYVLRLLEKSIALKDQSMQSMDYGVAIHSENVALCAITVAKALGFGKEKINHIYIGSRLHDVGKVAIPDSILMKPRKLNDEEYGVVKSHPVIGEEILDVIDFVFKVPFLEKIKSIVGEHHENYMGGGYPGRVKGDDISLCGRIVAICDAFDAITYGRQYAERKTTEEALDIICRNERGQFDVEIARVAQEALQRASNRLRRPA